MRIWTMVEPLDMPEVPHPGKSLPIVFSDHTQHLLVIGTDQLDGGLMLLECELLGATMDGELLPTPSGREQLVAVGAANASRSDPVETADRGNA